METAKYALKLYNQGLYGCVKNPDLDKQAREMFADGLGSTSAKIGRQVEFIGRDYGGAAGFKSAYALSRDIVANREQFEKVALSARPLLTQIASRDTIETLYRPFVKLLHGKSNWQVWATKSWHFLNPDAFAIELKRFEDFALSHQEWLPHLRQVDAGADGDVPCDDTKLWDKVFYGLGELKNNRRRG